MEFIEYFSDFRIVIKMSLEKYTVPKISLQKSTKHGPRSKSDHSQANFSRDQPPLNLNLRKSKNFPSFKFSKIDSGKQLELKKKRNLMLRNTCDETTLQGSSMKNEYVRILELQRQLSQILIRSLSQKKKSTVLQELIREIQRSLIEDQKAKNHAKLEEESNEKFLEKVKKEIDMISAWKNKFDIENKVSLAEILQQRRSRVNYSEIFHGFQKQIKQFELKYFMMLSRSQTMKKAIKSLEDKGGENGEIEKDRRESQSTQSEKNKKNKKFVSIKTRVSIEEASVDEKEYNERNSALTSLRFQTFKTIWSKHNRIHKKNSLNSAQILENEEQIKNLVTNYIFQIFESREEKSEFLQLKIKQIQELLELGNMKSGLIVQKIGQKKEIIKKQNKQLFEQIEQIEKQVSELQQMTKQHTNTINQLREKRQYETHTKQQIHKHKNTAQQILNIFCESSSQKFPGKLQNIPKTHQKLLEIIDELMLPVEKQKQKNQPSKLWSFQPLLFKTQQYDTLFSSTQCSTPKQKFLFPLRKKTKKILY